MIPIVIGALGMVSQDLEMRLIKRGDQKNKDHPDHRASKIK